MNQELTPENAIELARNGRDLNEMREALNSMAAQLTTLMSERSEMDVWTFDLLVTVGRLTAERGAARQLAASRLEQMVQDRKQALIWREKALAAEEMGITG